MVALGASDAALGPSLAFPALDWATMATAFTVLVLPQLPLSFANSCLATADAARVYFGEKAEAVRPGRLATSSVLPTCSPARSAACRSVTVPAA